MPIYQAVILGIIQGLTEFLPVSSTAHLVVFPWLFGWKDPSKAFDVALHVGTLIALIIYFRKDLWEVITGHDKRLLWLIVVGCLPLPVAAVADKMAERISNPSEFAAAPLIIAVCLMAFAVLLKVADTIGAKKRDVGKMSYAEAFFVGIGQVIAAVFPGSSRSGTTMTFGLFAGLTREATVRYSFLISVPTIAGAALYSMVKGHRELLAETGGPAPLLAGIVVSGLVGYLAIAFLMDYVRRKNMDVFFWYRLAAGAAIIAVYLMRR